MWNERFIAFILAVICALHPAADAATGAQGGTDDRTEFWGYVDVRPSAHMFYWLYHSYHQDGYLGRPLVIWLQGGPGGSSVGYGNFDLIGPLDRNLSERYTTWVKEANVLFIDNPVGAGYSYVDDPSAYTTDVQQITDDLTTFIVEFLVRYPEFKTIPLYVFGQSYGGKMGAHFARHLYIEQQEGRIDVNLVAFAMGNAWISPIDSTTTWGPLLYEMSLVDKEGMDAIREEAQKAVDAVDAGEWVNATAYWGSTEWVVIDETHGVDFYNILKFVDYWGTTLQHDNPELRLMLKKKPTGPSPKRRGGRLRHYASRPAAYTSQYEYRYTLDELMNGPIKEKVGIVPSSVTWGAQSDAVFDFQEGDFMKPVVDVVTDALENTTLEVIVYQGQLDLICDVAGAHQWVEKITWSEIDSYHDADRQYFVSDTTGEPEMYVKEHERFHFYSVLGGGHSIAKDNGVTAYRMLRRILGEDYVPITLPPPSSGRRAVVSGSLLAAVVLGLAVMNNSN